MPSVCVNTADNQDHYDTTDHAGQHHKLLQATQITSTFNYKSLLNHGLIIAKKTQNTKTTKDYTKNHHTQITGCKEC